MKLLHSKWGKIRGARQTPEHIKNIPKGYSGVVLKLAPSAHKLEIYLKNKKQGELLVDSIKEAKE